MEPGTDRGIALAADLDRHRDMAPGIVQVVAPGTDGAAAPGIDRDANRGTRREVDRGIGLEPDGAGRLDGYRERAAEVVAGPEIGRPTAVADFEAEAGPRAGFAVDIAEAEAAEQPAFGPVGAEGIDWVAAPWERQDFVLARAAPREDF